ncbi:MAG: divergent polysaccharide deacetylase family protein [Treponema sp.]|nr:divergent polysaccharide deacetylase family protein [Treponema sp.]
MNKNSNSVNRSKKRKTPAKKRTLRNRRVLSLSKTALLCVVIVAACFILLLINTEHDHSTIREPENSYKETTSVTEKIPSSVNSENKNDALPLPVPKSSDSSLQNGDKTQPAQNHALKHLSGGGPEVPEYSKVPEPKIIKTPSVIRDKKLSVSTESPLKQENQHSTRSFEIPAVPPAVHNARLVFVFDDAGQNVSQLEKYLTLPFPVTVAVLPKLTYSKACADRIRKSGNEVMLHQPMQAVNRNVNPGPGAITPDMQTAQIAALIRQNISEIGPVAGINNHEGSLISEDEVKIGTVMQTAKNCGIFFLDSRTTSQTRVPQASMELDIPYYERNVFLDNSKDRKDIVGEIMRGLDIANTKGAVIMIGHVWSADILPGILIEMYPVLRNKGYVFTTVSRSGAVIKP